MKEIKLKEIKSKFANTATDLALRVSTQTIDIFRKSHLHENLCQISMTYPFCENSLWLLATN